MGILQVSFRCERGLRCNEIYENNTAMKNFTMGNSLIAWLRTDKKNML